MKSGVILGSGHAIGALSNLSGNKILIQLLLLSASEDTWKRWKNPDFLYAGTGSTCWKFCAACTA